jgi:predicted phosphodiesterase
MTKLAIIPDLELYDREIGHTHGYADESLKNLDNLIDSIVSGGYDLVVFAGDIVYNPFRSETYRAQVYRRFMRLQSYLSAKMPNGVTIKNISGEIETINNTVFAIQGNHDKSPNKETFFKFMLDTGVIHTPLEIIGESWSAHFLHYVKDAKLAIETSRGHGRDKSKYNIEIMHLELDTAGIISAHGELTTYGWNHIEADLTVMAHLHTANELITQKRSDGTDFTVSVPGSIGRTKLNMATQRNFAQFVEVELESRDVQQHKIELKDWQEFFDLGSSIKTQKLQKSLSSYSRDLEIQDFKSLDPRELLVGLGLADNILQKALEYVE